VLVEVEGLAGEVEAHLHSHLGGDLDLLPLEVIQVHYGPVEVSLGASYLSLILSMRSILDIEGLLCADVHAVLPGVVDVMSGVVERFRLIQVRCVKAPRDDNPNRALNPIPLL